MSSDDSSDDDTEAVPLADESEHAEEGHSSTVSLANGGELSVTQSHQHNSRYHADMILVSLLEELARVRAAELLNSGNPGANYHRKSPEAQHLAKKIFVKASGLFAANDILPAELALDALQKERRQYIAAVDNIGLQTLQDHDLMSVETGNALSDVSRAQALIKTRPDHVAAQITDWLPKIDLNMNSVLLSSPLADMQLSAPNASHSRFRTDFHEIRTLGKGAFGHVYHVVNLVDKQPYAIKRIPLSHKIIRQWQDDKQQGTDNVLREIRTLAKLEHCNVVRYHGAWIEQPTRQPSLSLPLSRPATPSSPSTTRKLLTGKAPVRPLPGARVRDQQVQTLSTEDNGIVFGDDSSRPKPLFQIEEATDRQATSTVSFTDSNIFTDGRSRGQGESAKFPEYDSSFVLHIQMSVHPLTLTAYLSPPSATNRSSSLAKRHCFHLLPSLRILLGILCGVQYLHALGMVHRDIKPGNILLSEFTTSASPASGFYDVGTCAACPDSSPYFLNPRIADFGLVAEIACSEMLEKPKATRMAGTELYRPARTQLDKEQVAEVDESLDVFALGVVLFEMLYSFNTKMERHDCLSDLARGRLPKNFMTQLDGELQGAGAAISRCILGMVGCDPSVHWTCDKVKQEVELLHNRLEHAHGSDNSN